MAKEVKIGQQDYSVLVFIPDAASTDGSGKTGLVAANLTVSGVRVETDNDVTVIDYTATLNDLANITAAHADWGVKEVSSTLCPGIYRLDIADAIFATGAWSAVVYVMVTTSAASASPIEFILTPSSPYVGVQLDPAQGATTFSTLTVTGATTLTGLLDIDAGIDIDQSSVNGSGVTITGNGTGNGLVVTSGNGATGDAVQMTAASTAGNGLKLTGTTTGEGFNTNSIENTGTTVLTGATTLTGAVSLGSTLGVTGASTLASLSVTGQLDAGNVLVDTTTALTGAVTAPAGITANITGNITGTLATVTTLTNHPATVTLANGAHGGAGATITLQTPIAATVPNTQKVDVETIKTQAVTCAAGVTMLASVGTAATSTAQTGDSYAIVNGAAGLVAIDTVVDLIEDIVRNRMDITEATGAVSLKNDAGVEMLTGTVTSAAGTTTRTRLV